MAKQPPKKTGRKKSATHKVGIFDHISNITDKKAKWEDYSESDAKTFEPFMINRFLSMSYDLIEFINLFQKYTLGKLGKRETFKLYAGILPKQKYYLKYIKSTSEGNYVPELVEYIAKYFESSKTEAIDYLDIYYKTDEGIQEVREIIEKYGLEEKKITALLKVKK